MLKYWNSSASGLSIAITNQSPASDNEKILSENPNNTAFDLVTKTQNLAYQQYTLRPLDQRDIHRKNNDS